MSIGSLSSQQLRSLVEDKWQRDLQAVAVGLHVTPAWQGPNEVEFEFGTANVVRADTVFEVREALLAAEKQKGRIVLLTKLQQGDLGQDVVGRLARSRLFVIDHWANLCSLFKAKELDRSICDPAIAQVLLEYAPPDGYPPVSAGLLDAGTVWRAICRHVFEMGEREPDLVSLLLWAVSERGSARYLKANDEIRASLRRRLVANLGDAADSVLRFVEGGAGQDAMALSVVCQVVFGDGGDAILDAAAARMEQYHGNKPIAKAVGRNLGRAVVEAIADLDRRDDPRIAQQHLQRADELLRQFRCDDHAFRNSLSVLGFEHRLARLGAAIKQAVDDPGKEAIAACEDLQREVAGHRLAKLGRHQDRVSRTDMAIRLVRWLEQPVPSTVGLAEQANVYIKELSFVDWAREAIGRGDDVADLSAAYRHLDQVVSKRRAEFNEGFAKALADWASFGSKASGVMGVEDVLAQYVAKVAQANNRVLLVVLDGMSWAVCHELLDDIRQDHWFEVTLEESSIPPAPVLATIPSETDYSRTSLLSGRLTKGDLTVEHRNFEASTTLVQCCDRRYPPALFHKKNITEGSRGGIGDELSRRILSANHKIVGVVVNAIDDRLSNAQQIIDYWTISRINPLGALLRLARDSGRVVILASDHGHVWHRADAQYRAHEAGSRWRPNDDSCADDEIVLSGSRVLGDGNSNSVIAPWTETVYYGRQQNGYHGGATPQEMLAPLILLTDKSSAYSGLYSCEYPKPDWWSAAPVAAPVMEEPKVVIRISPPSGQQSLFDNLPPQEEPKPVAEGKAVVETQPKAGGDDWIDRLLSSRAYKDQKSMIRRHAPDDAVVRISLESLSASGGIMTPTAFARAADVPMARLDGLIAQMQRLLNVDGYEILTLDRNENRVELNVAKLKRQFDLD